MSVRKSGGAIGAVLTRGASISSCGKYRYQLTRWWGGSGPAWLPFVMLNPSTADADVDDPTIRRCIGFARRQGVQGLIVGNVYAYRSTDPKALVSAADPFGPENKAALRSIAVDANVCGMPVVCAWGVHGGIAGGANLALRCLREAGAHLVCLGRTKDGHPKHPLYVKGDQALEPFA